MSARPVYVYRLDVDIPAEYRKWDWAPEGWEGVQIAEDEWTEFSWPQRRNYPTAAAANRRAELLRGWGATVTVVRSEPVVFPSDGAAKGTP